MLDNDVEAWCAYLEENEQQAIADTAQAYPQDAKALALDYEKLSHRNNGLTERLHDDPEAELENARKALPHTNVPHSETLDGCRIRVGTIPEKEKPLSDLRDSDLGEFVTVRAQVSKTTEVRPRLDYAEWKCSCSHVETTVVVGDKLKSPGKCEMCEETNGWYLNDQNSTTRDHQIVELQPRAEEDAMNMTRTVPLHLYDELVDGVESGDRIRATGILTTDPVQPNSTVSARRPMQIEAHAVEKEQRDFDSYDTTREEEIKELANRNDLNELLVGSFATDILTGDRGDMHKLAVMLQLFGGVRHRLSDGGTKRGDINLLLIGAPGTGKSAYLNAAHQLAPKSIKASGKGATAAGLTATATQPDFGDGWMLDPGAMVLADGGLACIDEFDKMEQSARKSMHEAMEDQVIPINKAGINTTLTSRASVLAAANPKNGSFERMDALNQQINLGEALITRFDLVFALHDAPDKDKDREVAKHQFNVTEGIDPEIEPELLREYIAYARQNVEPAFNNQEAVDMLVDKYVDIRQNNSRGEDGEDAPVPVTARMNESLRRISEAAARAELSETVMPRHAEAAIELYKITIGDIGITEDGNLSAAKAAGNTPKSQKKRRQSVLEAIREYDDASREDVVELVAAPERKIREDIQHWKDKGEVYEPSQGVLRTT